MAIIMSDKNQTDLDKAKAKELEKAKNKSYGRTLGIITGLGLIVVGLGYIGNVAGFWSGFTLFFPGWWSLFILIPCLAGVLEYGIATAFTAGLVFGALMLVTRTGLLSSGWKLLLPAALVYGGLRLIFHNNPFGYRRIFDTDEGKSYFIPVYRSIIVKKNVKICDGFGGAEIISWFQPVTLDLTEAKIKTEAVIYARSMFAPITILVHPDINLRATRVSGGGKLTVDAVNYSDIINMPTLHVNAVCIGSGVIVKN